MTNISTSPPASRPWNLERVLDAAARLGISAEWKCPDTEGRYLHFPPMLLNWLPQRADVLSLDVEKARQAVAIFDAIKEALRREPPGLWKRRADGQTSEKFTHPALLSPVVIFPGKPREAASALRELATHLEENPP